jgi:ribosome maturation factor RimP
MDLETPVRSLLSSLDLELYDLEMASGTLNVIVTKAGGVDLESLTKANRVIGEWLDLNDPIPGHFTLDVSSPGLERKLRTAHHFRSALGTQVTLREVRDGEATRRLEGIITAVTDTSITLEEAELGTLDIAIDKIERARTVFVWGGEAKPSPSRGKAPAKKSPASTPKKKG